MGQTATERSMVCTLHAAITLPAITSLNASADLVRHVLLQEPTLS